MHDPRFPACRILLPHDDAIAVPIDLPEPQRTECRRAGCFAASQVKAGVMPGATNAVADNDAVDQRAVIVCAVRIDREYFRAGMHQQDLLLADMPDQFSIGKISERHALRQIRPGRRTLLL